MAEYNSEVTNCGSGTYQAASYHKAYFNGGTYTGGEQTSTFSM
jgi:hypothetical protein